MLGTQDSAPRGVVTTDEITRECERIAARLDRLNQRRKQGDVRPVLHVDYLPHAARVRAINDANRKFWDNRK